MGGRGIRLYLRAWGWGAEYFNHRTIALKSQPLSVFGFPLLSAELLRHSVCLLFTLLFMIDVGVLHCEAIIKCYFTEI